MNYKAVLALVYAHLVYDSNIWKSGEMVGEKLSVKNISAYNEPKLSRDSLNHVYRLIEWYLHWYSNCLYDIVQSPDDKVPQCVKSFLNDFIKWKKVDPIWRPAWFR